MAYKIGQYNKSSSTRTMDILGGGIVDRTSDTAVGGTGFKEECLTYASYFTKDVVYYFHGQIKRIVDQQVFDIILMNDDDFSETQIIQNFTVNGDSSGWTDIEFVFTPVKNFNRLVFLLHRIAKDYTTGQTRYPVIIYQELCEVRNILSEISGGTPLIKTGVQSSPGLITVINGEEIRVGKSGLYELKKDSIQVSFFSVVTAGSMSVDIENIKDEIDEIYPSTDLASNDLSTCLFVRVIGRTLPDFSVDFIYEEV